MKTPTLKPSLILISLIIAGTVLSFLPVCLADAEPEPLEQLEQELTEIEEELILIEKRVDSLLEDLIDPKITSFSLFFSQTDYTESTPLSVEFHLDGKLLAARQLSENDRLILLKGGALEVYSGIIEPGAHNIAVRGIMRASANASTEGHPPKATFKFEPRRASANFIEVILSYMKKDEDSGYHFSAKYWSKEL